MDIKHLYIVKEEHKENAQKQSFLVKNQNTGKFVRLGSRETLYLLQLLNEEDKAEELGIGNSERLGDEQAKQLKEKFEQSCLLTDMKSKRGKTRELSKIKLIEFNVENVMQKVYPIYIKLFSRVGLVGLILIAVANLALIISAVVQYTNTELVDVTLDFSVVDIVSYFLLVMLGISLHELAHGVVCMKYGGTVSKVGILLFYLLPAFYCDVTDIYLIQNRKKRAQVAIAGVYINVYFGLLLLLIAQVMSYFGVILIPVIAYAVTSICSSVYNLIPFVKLDGYWFISAVTGVDNFMDNSILSAYVTIFKRKKKNEIHMTRKKRIFLTFFGVCSLFFKPLFWGYSLIYFYNLLQFRESIKIVIVAILGIVIISDLAGTWLKSKKYINSRLNYV